MAGSSRIVPRDSRQRAACREPGKGAPQGAGGVGGLVAAGAVVVGLAAMSLLMVQGRPEVQPIDAATMAYPLPDKPSIAVLAFDDLSAGEDHGDLSDAISEGVIHQLSRFPELFVIARNSSFHYRGTATDIRQISRELGVRYILEGSQQKNGDRLRVTAQLIDASKGTGQHPYLTEAECNRLYETGIRQVAGRVNVICQTSALNMDEVIRRSQHAEKAGADALMILPPYLEGPADDDGLFEFYRTLDAAVGIDIVGYNIPQATGIAVSVPLLERLKGLRTYRWIKDSAGDFTTHQEYLQTGIDVLNGCDTTTFAALLAGTKGVIWGAANYMPHEAATLYRLIAARDFEAALTLWQRMLPSLLFLWRNPYVPAVLRAAQLRGYGTGHVRRSLQKLTAAQDAGLQKALAPLMG